MSGRGGDTLGGRYTLTDRIAAGGMGEVWQATDAVLGRTVAVKVLKGGVTDQVGFDERFRTEARLAAALTHANIAAVYDYGEDDGSAYLVMEYVPGLPLSRIIADRSPMPAVDAVGLVAQTATALQSAHSSGLVHRDVKPANVLVTADGIVKLTDFGIARAVGAAAMTKAGEVMGTAQYLAPEAALGRETTPLSDVYALAVVTYEMLAGRRPFDADSPVALAMAHVSEPPPGLPGFVPPPIRAVVLAALEKDPAYRPNSAAEYARALQQAVVDSDRMGFDPYSEPPRGDQGPGDRPENGGGGDTSGPPSAGPSGRRSRRERRSGSQPHTGVHQGDSSQCSGETPSRPQHTDGPSSGGQTSGPQPYARVEGPEGPFGAHQLPGRHTQQSPSEQPGHSSTRRMPGSQGPGGHITSPEPSESQERHEPDRSHEHDPRSGTQAFHDSGAQPAAHARPANRRTRLYLGAGALVLVAIVVAVLVWVFAGRGSGNSDEQFTDPVQTASLRQPGQLPEEPQ